MPDRADFRTLPTTRAAAAPHSETEIWQKLKDRGLAVVVIGREHNNEELATFKASKKFTFPIAADPKREVYGKYATQYIPRNVVIGQAGKVIFQSMGFDQAEPVKVE